MRREQGKVSGKAGGQPAASYREVLAGVVELLESARRTAARSVNAVMTAAYWEIGRRIVQHEQAGARRAGYGEEVLARLSNDLSKRFGRGFGLAHVQAMRQFYMAYPKPEIRQSLIDESGGRPEDSFPCPIPQSMIGEFARTAEVRLAPAIPQSVIGESAAAASSARSPAVLQSPIEELPTVARLVRAFPLSWTHYVRLLRVSNPFAREFYEAEALRGGWTVRQLDRQIGTQFYERTALSRNKAAMLTKGARPKAQDAVTPEEEIKEPLVLEFLGLKDEYSETELEEALIRHLEGFLLEMGGAFAFVGRQRRLRIDHEWFRVDLLFFHRRLRSLLVIDLKTGPFSHDDVGQMHLYLNYARHHWTQPGENPPVGLILCTEKGEALARYALEGLPNPMVVREYLTALPKERSLAAEIQKTRRLLVERRRAQADRTAQERLGPAVPREVKVRRAAKGRRKGLKTGKRPQA